MVEGKVYKLVLCTGNEVENLGLNMVFVLDGNSNKGAYVKRCLLFDLFKAFE